MTFDPTKPVQTRDGRKARIICTDLKNSGGSIVAITEEYPDREMVRRYYEDGRWLVGKDRQHDLINIPEKRWAVIWGDPESVKIYTSQDAALYDARECGGLACLEFTEGDGL